jgi:hypothetical protein
MVFVQKARYLISKYAKNAKYVKYAQYVASHDPPLRARCTQQEAVLHQECQFLKSSSYIIA